MIRHGVELCRRLRLFGSKARPLGSSLVQVVSRKKEAGLW